MAVIYPALGEEKAVAQQLLNMATSARDVQVSTDTAPGTGNVAFVVPDGLHERYVEALKVTEETVATPAPVKRRGRPRKAVPATVEEVAPEESEDGTEDESDTENDEDPEE